MADSMPTPWIYPYLVSIAEAHGGDLIQVPRFTKGKKVQILEFLTFQDDDCAWACISDKDTKIPAKFSKEAVMDYRRRADGRRFTENKFAVVTIKKFRPSFARVPIGNNGPKMTEMPHLFLEIDSVTVFATPEHKLGSPVETDANEDLKIWAEGMRKDGGEGNVLKIRKHERDQATKASSKDEPAVERLVPAALTKIKSTTSSKPNPQEGKNDRCTSIKGKVYEWQFELEREYHKAFKGMDDWDYRMIPQPPCLPCNTSSPQKQTTPTPSEWSASNPASPSRHAGMSSQYREADGWPGERSPPTVSFSLPTPAQRARARSTPLRDVEILMTDPPTSSLPPLLESSSPVCSNPPRPVPRVLKRNVAPPAQAGTSQPTGRVLVPNSDTSGTQPSQQSQTSQKPRAANGKVIDSQSSKGEMLPPSYLPTAEFVVAVSLQPLSSSQNQPSPQSLARKTSHNIASSASGGSQSPRAAADNNPVPSPSRSQGDDSDEEDENAPTSGPQPEHQGQSTVRLQEIQVETSYFEEQELHRGDSDEDASRLSEDDRVVDDMLNKDSRAQSPQIAGITSASMYPPSSKSSQSPPQNVISASMHSLFSTHSQSQTHPSQSTAITPMHSLFSNGSSPNPSPSPSADPESPLACKSRRQSEEASAHDPISWREPSFMRDRKGKGKAVADDFASGENRSGSKEKGGIKATVDKPVQQEAHVAAKKRPRSSVGTPSLRKRVKHTLDEARPSHQRSPSPPDADADRHHQPSASHQRCEASVANSRENSEVDASQASTSSRSGRRKRLGGFTVDFDNIPEPPGVPRMRTTWQELERILLRTGIIRTQGEDANIPDLL